MNKRILAGILSFIMILSMIPFSVFAKDSFADMPNNWSTEALIKAVENGLLNGYEEGGKKLIKPSRPITRAELATVVNRAFGAFNMASLEDVVDVPKGAWYENEMARALQMRTLSKDTRLRPNANITRQEAFTVLARAFRLTAKDISVLDKFTDRKDIADWAVDSIAAMAEAGYVQGSDNMLKPKNNITRAEFATVMDNLVKQHLVDKKTVSNVVEEGNVLIRTAGTKLNNVTINGDLIIADGVDDGDITLNNVIVKGRTVVRGGGENSIIIKGDSSIDNIVVYKLQGQVRIKTEGKALVDVVYIDDGSDDVIIDGKVNRVVVASEGISVTAEKGSVIENLDIIKENVIIQGTGNVKNIDVKEGGDNALINTPNTKIIVEENVNGVKGGSSDIEAGKTATMNSQGTAVFTGFPGGGGIVIPPPPPPPKYSITINTDGNGAASASTTSATAGTQITLTATPNEGYLFDKWEVVSGGVTVTDNKFTMPSKNVVIKAKFKAIIVEVSAISIKNNDGPDDVLVVGDNLEAVASGQPNITADYKWMRADTEDGDYTVITNEISSNYKLTDNDENKYIKVEVTGTQKYDGIVLSEATEKVKKLTSINIKTEPSNLTYIEGQSLNLSGLEIELNYSDSTKEEIALADFASRNITTEPEDGSILGIVQSNNPIAISAYGETVNTSNLKVDAKSLSAITIKEEPKKMLYVDGQKLDLTGLVVTLEFDNGDKSDIAWDAFGDNNLIAKPANNTELNISNHHNKPITISRGDKEVKTGNLSVVAKEVTDISVVSQPELNYVEGQKLDLSGLKVSLTYNDATTEEVDFANFGSDIAVSLANETKLNKATHNNTKITVTHSSTNLSTEASALKVVDKVVENITIKNEPSKLNYVEGDKLDLTDLEVNLSYNDNTIEEVALDKFGETGITVEPGNGTELKLDDHGTTIKITHSDSNKYVETNALIVTQAKYEISVKKPVDGNVTFTAENGDGDKAPIGSKVTVTVTVTPNVKKQLLALSVKNGDMNISNDVNLAENVDEIGKEFTFTMPGNDVTIDATIGDPNKLSIDLGVSTQIDLTNGILDDFPKLTWSYFTNTLKLDSYEGNHLGVLGGQTYQLDFKLIGTNKITNSMHVTPGLKFIDSAVIKGDGTLEINNKFKDDAERVRGIEFSSSNGKVNITENATIDVIVEAKGNGGVAISNTMPFIGNGQVAYKGTAAWGVNDGNTTGNPIKITYRVSQGTNLYGKNIYANNNLVEDIWSDSFDGSAIVSETPIDFVENQAIVCVKHKDRFYEITIIRDIAINNFSNTSKTDTTADFTWTQAAGATGIKIMQFLKDGDEWTEAAIQGELLRTDTSATVTGLSPSKEYKFKLVVEGGDNRGDSNVVEVKTLVEPQAQLDVDNETTKYESAATIEKTVEAGNDVTDMIVKLLVDKEAGSDIDLSYSVSPGTYLEVENSAIKLKMQNFTENDVTEIVTITFTKGGRTATKQVTVTIKSSNKKMIKIGGIEYDLNGDALPDGLSWNDKNKVLTMNSYSGGAIHTNFEAGYELKNLVINGENTITVNDESSTKPVIGFGTKTDLNITGDGTLEISITKVESNQPIIGIYSGAYKTDSGSTLGTASGNTINLNESITISIDVDAKSGVSYAMYADTLNLNNGTLEIASKSGNNHAYGIYANFNYTTGTVKLSDDKEIFAGLLSKFSPFFSKETPYVTNGKARKITGLTWNSDKNATEASKAVEYTIYFESDLDKLQVEDIKAIVDTKEVYEESFESNKLDEEDTINLDENGKAIVYVKTTKNSKDRYFKINLIKEIQTP